MMATRDSSLFDLTNPLVYFKHKLIFTLKYISLFVALWLGVRKFLFSHGEHREHGERGA